MCDSKVKFLNLKVATVSLEMYDKKGGLFITKVQV